MAQIFLSTNLKHIRTCLEETQTEMCNRLGINLKKYQSYEKYDIEPPYAMLNDICGKLGLTADQILFNDLVKTHTDTDVLRLIAKVK